MSIILCRCGGTHSTKEEWLRCEYVRAKVSQKDPVPVLRDPRQMTFDFDGEEE